MNIWFYTLKIKNKNKKSYLNKHGITNIKMENILKEDLFWLFFLQKDYFDLKLFPRSESMRPNSKGIKKN